jgi:hypothetical protein
MNDSSIIVGMQPIYTLIRNCACVWRDRVGLSIFKKHPNVHEYASNVPLYQSRRWLSLAHLWKDASDYFVPILDEQQKF